MISVKYYAFALILVFTRIYSQTIQINVDKNFVQEGEFISLKIEADGANDFPLADLSPLDSDFEIISGPSQQTNIQWINGKMKNTKILKWNLLPKKMGDIIIPPIVLKIGNKSFSGKPISINVSASKGNSDKSIFIKADLDKSEAYLGEQISLSYKLYKQINDTISNIDQFDMPDFKGFWVEEIYSPQRLQYNSKTETIDGIRYQVANLGQKVLFPISTTELEIEPLRIKIYEHKDDKNTSHDPFFDPFFDETKTKMIKSHKLKISTKDYPKPIPTHFSGAVGKFSFSNEISRNKIEVNEEFYVKFTITGFGNIGQFSFPKVDLPKYLEQISVKEGIKKEIFNDKVKGTKTFKIYVKAKKSGNYSIPITSLSYFDPNDETWQEVSTNYLNFKVKGVSISGNASNQKRRMKNDDSDIYLIALDISSSMLANDFPPSRLNVIKEELKYFFKQMTGKKIGIISFSGYTTVESAITKNHYLLNYILDDVSVSSKAKYGTAIGLAIGQSILHANQFLSKNKEIILITDGSNNSGNIDPITSANLAKENNIKIHTIAVGSNNSFVKISGRGMISNIIDTETLKKISKITNGEFFRAKSEDQIKLALKTIIDIN